MYIKKKIQSFHDLQAGAWSGALQTLEEVEKQGREDDLMILLEEVFFDETPTDTAVNDFLWFDAADMMGLYDDETEEEEA